MVFIARRRNSMFNVSSKLAVIFLVAMLAVLCQPIAACVVLPPDQPVTTQPSTTTSPEKSDKKGDPIDVANGAVTETATDFVLPGVTFGWEHKRSYTSGYASGTFIQGSNWQVETLTDYLSQDSSGNITLVRTDMRQALFVKSGVAPNDTYTALDSFHGTLIHDNVNHVFVVEETDSGERFTFYDFTLAYPPQRGKLKEYTDRYGTEKITFEYSPTTYNGRIVSATTSQGWRARYVYIGGFYANSGKISYIDVEKRLQDGTYQVLQRVRYTYCTSGWPYSADVGSTGDLVQVDMLKRSTLDDLTKTTDAYFSIKRTTMYRYYSSGNAEGSAHKLKMVFSPEAVDQAVREGNTSAAVLLQKADNAVIAGSKTLRDYANVAYGYYTSDLNTTNIGPANGGVGGSSENLEAKYGGQPFDETGFVKCQTIRKDYKGYLGTRYFFYMANSEPGTSYNAVTRTVVEDTQETGVRKIYGMNKDRKTLREIVIDSPAAASPKYWCTSYKQGSGIGDANQILEKRMPSSHNCIDTAAKVATFLDVDSDWSNTDIANASSGVIYGYSYNSDGRLVDEKIKKGFQGSECFIRATDYGTGASNQPKYLPIASYVYPVAETSRTASTRLTTSYSYEFHDGDTTARQLKKRTVTYPTVSTSQNGSGITTTTGEYYDDRGRLRWTQDGEGYVKYYSYNANTGGIGYMMEDVNTASLPSEITSGSSPTWLPWSGSVPFSSTASAPLQLVTKVEYDDLGRQIKIQDAEGLLTCTAYGADQTRTYPGWNTTSHTAALPIQVTKVNKDELATDTYTLDPAGVAEGYATSNLPTGADTGEGQDDYISWTRYSYNATTALLEIADRYSTIPASGTGTLSTNFNRTFYRYDSLGQTTGVIEVVSGSDATGLTGCVEQVTKTDYDVLGRVTSIRRGVSDANHVMKTTSLYDTDPASLVKVGEKFYDESSPGSGTSGAGDGLLTSTFTYYDANNIDVSHAVKVAYHYDWRGWLRGVEPEVAPYTVRDVDNLGRVTATAQYQGNVTWSTVVGDEDFAATVASDGGTAARRGSLAKSMFDDMGRAYRSEVYAVDPATGAAGNKLVSDNYYDRNSRLVATASPAKGATEIAYDGAGRVAESRSVVELASTKYTSGAFNYRNPQPGATTGGDDGVLQLSRLVYEKVGNLTQSISMEMNHDDTTNVGIKLDSNPKDFVQTFAYNWYDPATHYLMTTANYGSGNSNWAYAAAPAYASYAGRPTASGTDYLVSTFEYAKGRLEKVHDPKGLIAKTTYDALGRKVKFEEQDASQNVLRVTLTQYDGLKNVVKLVADLSRNGAIDDGSDEVTTYAFADSHDASLVTRIQYPDGNSTDDNVSLAYDLDGQIALRTAQKHAGETANVIAFSYDSTLRRLQNQRVTTLGTNVDGSIQSMAYGYDTLGRRQSITSYSDNSTTTIANEVVYDYDSLGALSKEHQEHAGAKGGGTPFVQYNYDTTAASGVLTKASRLASVTYPSGRKIFYNFGTADALNDKISRIAAIKDDNGSGAEGVVLAAYSYSGTGRLAVEDFQQPQVRLDYFGGTGGTYAGLDRFGRIKQQLWRDYGASADREKFTHDYDYNSNRKYRENVLAATVSEVYGYDNLNRLTSSKRGQLNANKDDVPTPAKTQGWTLDDVGNWSQFNDSGTSQTCTHNAANEITDISTTSNDPAYDARGNMVQDQTQTYKYDSWNRLVEVRNRGNGSLIASYGYDGLNRRVKKTVGAAGTDFYYNVDWQVLEERKSGNAYAQYVWSQRYVDAPVCRFRDSDGNGSLDETLYYLTDANMNVTTLVDANGDAVERYVYDPYGAVTIYDATWANTRPSSSYANEVLYCGYRFDSESGLYHVRNRIYHPTLGRWLQRDLLEYVDGMSLYGYALGHPVMGLDPFGLRWSLWDAIMLGDGRFTENHERTDRQTAARMRALAAQKEREAAAARQGSPEPPPGTTTGSSNNQDPAAPVTSKDGEKKKNEAQNQSDAEKAAKDAQKLRDMAAQLDADVDSMSDRLSDAYLDGLAEGAGDGLQIAANAYSGGLTDALNITNADQLVAQNGDMYKYAQISANISAVAASAVLGGTQNAVTNAVSKGAGKVVQAAKNVGKQLVSHDGIKGKIGQTAFRIGGKNGNVSINMVTKRGRYAIDYHPNPGTKLHVHAPNYKPH